MSDTDAAKREPLTWSFPVPETSVNIQRLAVLIQVFERMDKIERDAALGYFNARWPQ